MTSNQWQEGLDSLLAGRVDDAIRQLGAVVQANPESFEGNLFLGSALAQGGQSQPAVGYLQNAVRLNPQSSQAHFNLGRVYLTLGQRDLARGEFETALAFKPDYDAASDELKALGVAPRTAPTVVPAMGITADPAGASVPLSQPATVVTPIYGAAQAKIASTAPTTSECVVGAVFGLATAILGAVAWAAITYSTHIELGIVAVGLGYGVGMAVVKGAGEKIGPTLQLIGAVLAGFSGLLGQAFIAFLNLHADPRAVGVSPIALMVYACQSLPQVIGADPLSLLFIAIGTYEGWKIPGGRSVRRRAVF